MNRNRVDDTGNKAYWLSRRLALQKDWEFSRELGLKYDPSLQGQYDFAQKEWQDAQEKYNQFALTRPDAADLGIFKPPAFASRCRCGCQDFMYPISMFTSGKRKQGC